jgi:hypothetical protein
MEREVKRMNKKVLVTFVALMAVAMLATPLVGLATAKSPGEQKVPVKIVWAPVAGSSTTIEINYSDGLSHRVITNKWTLQLFIDDAVTPVAGTANCTRYVLYAFAKEPQMGVYHDEYVISFPSLGGGFEGTAQFRIYDYVSSTNYNIQVHAVFKGTGDCEGKTLNVGVDRGPANLQWEGYLLKP